MKFRCDYPGCNRIPYVEVYFLKQKIRHYFCLWHYLKIRYFEVKRKIPSVRLYREYRQIAKSYCNIIRRRKKEMNKWNKRHGIETKIDMVRLKKRVTSFIREEILSEMKK